MYSIPNGKILFPAMMPKAYGMNSVRIVETGAEFQVPEPFRQRRDRVWKAVLEKAERLIAEGRRKGMPTGGPLYRLDGFGAGADSATLYVGKTRFEDRMGTNWEAGKDPSYCKELERYGAEKLGSRSACFANALSMCTVIETETEKGDPALIVGMRGYEQDEYPLTLHVPGTVGNRRYFEEKGKKFDPFESLMAEVLYKEMGLADSDIESLCMTGLTENSFSLNPELAFYAKTSGSICFEKIEKERFSRAPQKAEHVKIFPVKPSELPGLLESTQDPRNYDFLQNLSLRSEDKDRIRNLVEKRPEIIANTANWWVPPGELCLLLYLANIGYDPASLSYVKRA
jgi:hypothetical protein